MASCMLGDCCCCIELRTGSLVIGYLNLIGQIVMIVRGFLSTLASSVLMNSRDPREHSIGVTLLIISLVLLLVFLLFFAFTVALLVGVHKDKSGHVKAYLVFNVIWIVIALALFIASIFVMGNVIVIVIWAIGIALNIYFLLVIRSYYYQMKENVSAPTTMYKGAA